MTTIQRTKCFVLDYGYIYVAINRSIPGYAKVGRTKNIAERMNQLSKSTPIPFECLYYCKTAFTTKVETNLKCKDETIIDYMSDSEWVELDDNKSLYTCVDNLIECVSREIHDYLKEDYRYCDILWKTVDTEEVMWFKNSNGHRIDKEIVEECPKEVILSEKFYKNYNPNWHYDNVLKSKLAA